RGLGLLHLLKKDFDELHKPQAISSSAGYLRRIFSLFATHVAEMAAPGQSASGRFIALSSDPLICMCCGSEVSTCPIIFQQTASAGSPWRETPSAPRARL